MPRTRTPPTRSVRTWPAVGRGALVLGVVAVLAAGCVSLPAERSAEGDPWVPVTQERAEAYLKRHDRVVAEATEKRAAELVERVQGGALAERRAASFAVSKAHDPKYGEPLDTWRHTDPAIYVPELTDYPIRFVTVSSLAREGTEAGEGKWVNVGLVRRSNASSPWKKVISVDVATADLPELEHGANNAMSEVTKDNADDLQLAPTRAANALATYLGDPTAEERRFFADHDFIAERHAEIDPGKNPVTISSSFRIEGAPIAMRASDGGAVVVFALRDEFELSVTGNGTISVPPDSVEAALAGKRRGTAISLDRLTEVVLYVPTRDAEDGKARLLGTSAQIVAATIT